MGKLCDWIDHRTGYRYLLHALLLLNFPVSRGARWRYVWGGSLALMLLVELVTGTLMMTIYSPSEASAWGSVQYMETEVRWGWLVRGVHHYISHMMLAVILLHTLIVVITAGYRKPKEFTYWSGLLLGGVTLALAISGNPLPWDQKGYWAYQIETGIAGTMPVIGPSLRTLMVGGSEFGNLTLTRLYTLHVVVLPVLAMFLLVIHVALMRREKLNLAKASNDPLPIVKTEADSTSDCSSDDLEPYWPFQTTRNMLMFGLLMAIIVGQLVMYPRIKEGHVAPPQAEWEPDLPTTDIALGTPADPDLSYVARPEWYVRFLFELRHLVAKENEVLITGVLPLVIVVLLFLLPFYEKIFGTKVGYYFSNVLFTSGLLAVLVLTYVGISRDHNDEEFLQARRRELDYAGRATWLARSNGIPPEGPVTLLHNDPKAMGPIIFAAHCASCHRWNGHDGTGRTVRESVDGEKVVATPTASDLYRFGSKEWLVDFLSNPQDDRFFGHMDRLNGGEEIKDGEMAGWAEENVGSEGVLQKNHLAAVAALLAREANLPSEAAASDEEITLGVALFSGGELTDESGEPLEFEGYCLQCHSLKAGDPEEEGGGDAPDLNGYASAAWLRDFIRKPAAERFYGETNVMPAYDSTQISDRDLDLLVRWMRGEWDRSKTSE